METNKKADRKEALESKLKALELVKSDMVESTNCHYKEGLEAVEIRIIQIKSIVEEMETPEFKMVDLPEKTDKVKNAMFETVWNDGETCYCCGKRVKTAKAYWFAQSCDGLVYDVNDPEANNMEGEGGISIGWFALGSECKNKLPKTHTERKPHWS